MNKSNNFRRKKPELFRIKGCKDCNKKCLWNSLCATKEVAERNAIIFPCNSEKKEIKDEKKC